VTEIFGLAIPLPLILVGPVAVAICGLLGYTLGRFLVTVVSRGVRHTETKVDDVIVRALRTPIAVAAGLGGVWLALRGLPLDSEIDPYLNRGWIILATLLLVSIGLRLINGFTKEILRDSPVFGPASGVIRVVGRMIVLSLGLVMVLQSFGIAVEPLIASLGIGSLAVALALKDTLANLFAGVYIFADRPLRVGDYVRLESGQEGYVHQIGWRATRIRMPANNLIIVPNEKIVQSILTNFDMPEPAMTLVFTLPVSYEADPRRVMAILQEVLAASVGSIPGVLPDPEPSVRFARGFAESAFEFTLAVRIARFADQVDVQSELRARIFERLQKEGIEVPYPQRTVRAPKIEALLERRLAADAPGGGAPQAPDR
jgi:small-conductance mechanosensitive channel